ncbi:hypothetical protein SG34_030205 [Thalassomonas viridans]|uniref:DUF3379 domain-containing protein n=1 Tax=Thalassomonas viridans TaxID=137584 RepID=A0AAE9ZB60_9GAMM|nr:hypothetical protein [Thalassomonas viridans]WDE09050.1 hypothetical protein SG34_030205 [Thalassomonas viridans]
MKKPLKQELSNHYRDKQLSGEQLEKLHRLQANAGKAHMTGQGKASWLQRLSKFLDRFYEGDKASSLKLSWSISALAVGFVLVLGIRAGLAPSQDEKVVSEIAYNHNKQAAMEVKSAALSDVSNYLSKLDFSLINSERFASPEWQLLGGRYCSIQGSLAAQLRIRNTQTGKVMTLYQTKLPQYSPAIGDTHLGYDAGVKVELWSEKGLILGLAQSEVDN